MSQSVCKSCKHFVPGPHKVRELNCDGYCYRYPDRYDKNFNTPKCGEWKNKAPRKQTKNSTDKSPEFLEFYEACPLKRAPGHAWKAWQKLSPDIYQLAIKQIKAYAVSVKGSSQIKHPATWLNAECWTDNYEEESDNRACEDCAAPYEDHWKYYKIENKKKYYRCDSCKK